MNEPDFILGREYLVRGGGLRTGALSLLMSKLLAGGFVVLPSDTSFSLATLPRDAAVHSRVNSILSRPSGPVSLAFANIPHATPAWIELSPAAAQILEKFTPGPVTVVCRAAESLPLPFFSGTIAAPNRTIGVRISDSVIERDVSRCTAYPVTTIAIRNPKTGEPIRDLGAAIEIVKAGLARTAKAGWIAVDGGGFYGSHSTVVDTTAGPPGSPGVRLIRAGDVPFSLIEDAVRSLPAYSLQDWG